jgi:glutaredoxin
MKWFGSGKRNKPEQTHKTSSQVNSSQATQPSQKLQPDIIVYGTEDDRRCRALRELLDASGFAFRDERVDEDLSTRAWLQRTTGDDALPKLFIGAQYYGTYEDIQAVALNGELKRILSGEAAKEELDRKRLKAEMSVTSIIQLLREEESLVINEEGVETETWLEPPRQPNFILLQGEPHPIDEIDRIVTSIVERHKRGEISLGWRSDEA